MTLKTCPFCNGNNPRIIFDRVSYHVGCPECGVSSSFSCDKETAITAWNTRPREAELLEVIRQVQKVIYLSCVDEAAIEWIHASDELEKAVEKILKKYEVEG